jgi:hypothetical protein
MDQLLEFCAQPFVLGGIIAPLVVIILSSIVRFARGVKLSAFADVIGVLLCVDVAAIAAPEDISVLVATQQPAKLIAQQHLLLFLWGLVCWAIVLAILEPIILNESRSVRRGPFFDRGWSAGARAAAWITSVFLAWTLLWLHFRIWTKHL